MRVSLRRIACCAAVLLALQGCAKPMPDAQYLTRVEVYFRDFDAPSQETHTADSLPRAATTKADLTDAPSIARVMATKTPYMATVYFVAEGNDAAEATSALAKLVESDFVDDGNGG